MALVVYSKSRSFENHINKVVADDVTVRNSLSPPVAGDGNVYLVHGSSFAKDLPDWLLTSRKKGVVIAIAAKTPDLDNLLSYTEIGVLGYFNAYMSAPNYDQMLRLLVNGQSWYPAPLLSQAFDIARSLVRKKSVPDELDKLTKREREVALLVSEGKSNKLVASECGMTERTVKAHLTQVFKKLQVKDRVALVIYLNQFDDINQSTTG